MVRVYVHDLKVLLELPKFPVDYYCYDSDHNSLLIQTKKKELHHHITWNNVIMPSFFSRGPYHLAVITVASCCAGDCSLLLSTIEVSVDKLYLGFLGTMDRLWKLERWPFLRRSLPPRRWAGLGLLLCLLYPGRPTWFCYLLGGQT